MYKLSPKASFFEGLGRTVDFDDNLQQYHYSENPDEADAKAIYSDFLFVGSLFEDFLRTYYSTYYSDVEEEQ